MADAIGYDEMVHMLRGAAEKVITQHERLSKLDAAIGDGDHGTTMARGMGLIEQAAADGNERAELAIETFAEAVRYYIGAYLVALGDPYEPNGSRGEAAGAAPVGHFGAVEEAETVRREAEFG